MNKLTLNPIEKLPTGIPGFDHVSKGGLPLHRTTLISGTAGSAKTVFAAQFLAEGIYQYGQNGVFITFEEPVDDIRRNMLSFGWPITEWEKENKWAFVDASPQPNEANIIVGDYDLGALLARIENAVKKTNAQRLSMDSIGAIERRWAFAFLTAFLFLPAILLSHVDNNVFSSLW